MKSFLTLASIFLTISSSHSVVPRSAVSKAEFVIHGIYTTSDPSCQSGLVATLPLAVAGRTVNFAQKAAIGATSGFSDEINCIIIVMKSGIRMDVVAGSYGGGNPCNSGATSVDADYQISAGQTIDWPATITSDAAAVGLTLTTTASIATSPTNANSVVPIYLSTNSSCTTSSLPAGAGCTSWPQGYRSPPTASHKTRGFKLDQIASGGSYDFIFDVDDILGDSGGGVCGIIRAPKITFEPR